jgi:hypothetical protein
MCLAVSRNSRIRIATKDIHTYKLVIKDFGRYVSSFRYYPCHLNVILKTDLGRKKSNYGKLAVIPYYIELGFHTFKSKKVAEKYANKYKELVIKATIPKGSKYWCGKFEEDISFCSDQIIYSEL